MPERKLRVLYSFPVRLGRAAGVGTTAWYQVDGLLRQGASVDLFCGSLERPLPQLNKLYETLTMFGVKIPIRVMGKTKAKKYHDMVVAGAIKRSAEKYDIVHCWPSAAMRTLKAAKERGIRSVLERPCCHTRVVFDAVAMECRKLGMELERSHFTAFDKKRLAREEQEFSLADKLLCPSEWCAKSFIDQGTSEKRIAVHQYGYDPAFFHLPADDQRDDDPTFKMAFVGRCEPGKGLHYALDAWLTSEASRNGIFYICGDYVQGYKDLLKDKLSHPSIREMGFLSDPALVLQKCHALVLPSISEGSALVTYEARACGCALLVSEASGAHCQDMRDALVHRVGDVAALCRHIDAIAGNREFFREIRERSIAGLENLTWKKAGEVLLSTYQDCIDETF